jgi:regulator of replication initiation timing
MKAEENAAIILLADEVNVLTDRCRVLEASMVELFKRNDQLRAENEKLKRDSGNKLKNVNV